jgi:hypothetical protein
VGPDESLHSELLCSNHEDGTSQMALAFFGSVQMQTFDASKALNVTQTLFGATLRCVLHVLSKVPEHADELGSLELLLKLLHFLFG